MLWLGALACVIVPGLIFWAMGGIKQSIDFQGGTELQIPFATRHTADEIQTRRGLARRQVQGQPGRGLRRPDAAFKHLATVTTERLTSRSAPNLLQT